MYKPEPLNWIAGDDSRLRTAPSHLGQISTSGSENFWIRSKRLPQALHSVLVKWHLSPREPRPQSISSPFCGPSMSERCSQIGTVPLPSSVSWKARSENLAPMWAL